MEIQKGTAQLVTSRSAEGTLLIQLAGWPAHGSSIVGRQHAMPSDLRWRDSGGLLTQPTRRLQACGANALANRCIDGTILAYAIACLWSLL
jgi:hypothetical protein